MAKRAGNAKEKKPSYCKGGAGNRDAAEEVSHAVNHPLRLDCMSVLIERIASPIELARMFGKSVATVNFHVTELLKAGAIEQIKTVQRRGAVEHFYRATVRPVVTDEEWRAMDAFARREMAGALVHAIVTEGLASLRHKRMEEDDNLCLAWKVIPVDAQGEREVAKFQADSIERFEAIRKANEVRNADSEVGDRAQRVVVVMCFDRAQPGVRIGNDKPNLPKESKKVRRRRRG